MGRILRVLEWLWTPPGSFIASPRNNTVSTLLVGVVGIAMPALSVDLLLLELLFSVIRYGYVIKWTIICQICNELSPSMDRREEIFWFDRFHRIGCSSPFINFSTRSSTLTAWTILGRSPGRRAQHFVIRVSKIAGHPRILGGRIPTRYMGQLTDHDNIILQSVCWKAKAPRFFGGKFGNPGA